MPFHPGAAKFYKEQGITVKSALTTSRAPAGASSVRRQVRTRCRTAGHAGTAERRRQWSRSQWPLPHLRHRLRIAACFSYRRRRVMMSLYHMWAIVFGTPEAIIFRGTHLLFAMVADFLCSAESPTRRERSRARRPAGRAGPTGAAGLLLIAARRSVLPLRQLRLHRQPHLLHRRPDHRRHGAGRHHDRDGAGGDAARASAGRCRSPPSCSSLYGLFIAKLEPMRLIDQLYHDDGGHLRHPAGGLGRPT